MAYLLVTIDTEEDMPKWRPEKVSSTENISKLPFLHAFLKQHGVQPTYLVNQPVLENNDSLNVVKGLAAEGGCEIGAHLHSWNTPPLSKIEKQGTATYLSRQEKAIKRAKLTHFTNLFHEKMGFFPTSYRAGRYGFCQDSAQILSELGYRVDSSIAPLIDFSSDGGPNFKSFDAHPFWFTNSEANKILEVPISISLVHNFPKYFEKFYFQIPNWTKIKGIIHRTNLARLLWLRPTTYSAKEMRQLADYLLDQEGVSFLNIMFHSSEVYPGATPYNKTENDVAMFYERLSNILGYLIESKFLKSCTLTGFEEICSKSEKKLKTISITEEAKGLF